MWTSARSSRSQARARATELGVGDRVTFIHGDAAGYVADEPVDLVACVGATWIGGGVARTVDLLRRSLRDGGLMLIGEPYWRREPPDQDTVEACEATDKEDFRSLPALIEQFGPSTTTSWRCCLPIKTAGTVIKRRSG